MGLETFNMNMSQEACHLFAGMSIGGMIWIRLAFLVVCIWIIGKLINPSLQILGIKLRDSIIKSKKKSKYIRR